MSLTNLVKIGVDGMCKCSCADTCPLGKTGMQSRCTVKELKARGIEVSHPDGWRCDFCLVPLPTWDVVYETLHYKFGTVTLCRQCYINQRNNVR